MDRVRAGDAGGRQDRRDVEVAVLRRRRPDAHALIRQPHMHRLGVGGGVHRDGRDAQLAAGALDAKRDLAAVGDEDLLEQGDAHSFQDHQHFAVLDRRAVGDQDARHGAGPRCLDLVEGLHRLDQQQRLPGGDALADGNEGRRARLRQQIGDARPSGWSPRPDAPRVPPRPRPAPATGGRRVRRRHGPAAARRRHRRRARTTRMRLSFSAISISVRPVSVSTAASARIASGSNGMRRHASAPSLSASSSSAIAVQRQRVAADAAAGRSRPTADLGDVGVLAELLAAVDVGHVHLDHRQFDGQQRVHQRDGGGGVAGRD